MIHIITTGGTIEGLEHDNEEKEPENVGVTIKGFLVAANVSFEYSLERMFNKDSRFITAEDRKELAQRIDASKLERVLVTHGTLTMAETAKYLGQLHFKKTIVLVGSLILGTSKNSDAQFNLGYSICALQNLGNGVYIAMNGTVFSWENVVKNVEQNRFEKNA